MTLGEMLAGIAALFVHGNPFAWGCGVVGLVIVIVVAIIESPWYEKRHPEPQSSTPSWRIYSRDSRHNR